MPCSASERDLLSRVAVAGVSPVLRTAQEELVRGLAALTGSEPLPVRTADAGQPHVLIAAPGSAAAAAAWAAAGRCRPRPSQARTRSSLLADVAEAAGPRRVVITGSTEAACLHGVFAFLRRLQAGQGVTGRAGLRLAEATANKLRMINHWDNIDGTIERGYAGSVDLLRRRPGDAGPAPGHRLRAAARVRRRERRQPQQRQCHPRGRAAAHPGAPAQARQARRGLPPLRHQAVHQHQLRLAHRAVRRAHRRPARRGRRRLVAAAGGGGLRAHPRPRRVRGEGGQRVPAWSARLRAHPGGGSERPRGRAARRTAGSWSGGPSCTTASRTGGTARPTGRAPPTTRSCRSTAPSPTTSSCRSSSARWTSRSGSRRRRCCSRCARPAQAIEVQITQEYTGQQKDLCFLHPQWHEVMALPATVGGRGRSHAGRTSSAGTGPAGPSAGSPASPTSGTTPPGPGTCSRRPTSTPSAGWPGTRRSSRGAVAAEWVTQTFGPAEPVFSAVLGMLLDSWGDLRELHGAARRRLDGHPALPLRPRHRRLRVLALGHVPLRRPRRHRGGPHGRRPGPGTPRSTSRPWRSCTRTSPAARTNCCSSSTTCRTGTG